MGQVGVADSANVGTVTQKQLEARTVYRPGELLEATPGLIVSQHSGEGKANQFYLRGFNLDHGTDLRTTVDGMPVNHAQHGHGQGYTDLNFLIPELVARCRYKKGPYYADEGDFGVGGRGRHQLRSTSCRQGIAQRRRRQLRLPARAARRLAGARRGHAALRASRLQHNDGPWDRPDDYRKFNGVLRYSQGDAQNGCNLTAMGYNGDGTPPTRSRSARSRAAARPLRRSTTRPTAASRSATACPAPGAAATESRPRSLPTWSHYDLNLFSNFTYFLDDPVNGDQFEQQDRRTMTGLNAQPAWASDWLGRESENTSACSCATTTSAIGLFNTKARQSPVDHARRPRRETSVGALRARTRCAGRRASAPWPACAATSPAST